MTFEEDFPNLNKMLFGKCTCKECGKQGYTLEEIQMFCIDKQKLIDAITKVENRLMEEWHGTDDGMWSEYLKKELGL